MPKKKNIKKRSAIEVVSTKELVPKVERENYEKFSKRFFDNEMQDEFSSFLKGNIQVKGKKNQKEEKIVIDLREMSSVANPAISATGKNYGVYNPSSIDYTTFDKMKDDPQISAALAFVKLPILALPWRIDCENEKIARTVEYCLKKVWRGMIRSMLTAVDYGFASHEKVFQLQNTKIRTRTKEEKSKTIYSGSLLSYKKIKPHHPSSVQVKIDDLDNFDGIIQTTSEGKDIILPKEKCLHFVHEDEFGNPFGKSRLIPAYKYWYWKEILYQFMLMYFERRGAPPIIATAPPGKSVDKSGTRRENLEVALDLASSLLSHSVAVLPYQASKQTNENMWALNYLLDDKRGEMFIQAINQLDLTILRAIWLPDTAVSEGSSYGQASVHADLFLMAEKGLVTDIEDTINKQVIPYLVQANFRPNEVVDCTVEMESLDFNRRIALKEIFIEMMRNMDNMVQIGMRPKIFPDIEKMAKILQVPITEFGGEFEEVEPAEEEIDEGKNGTGKSKSGVVTRAVPKRTSRTSFTGSREVDRQTLRPGGKRAEQMRAKMDEGTPLADPYDVDPGFKKHVELISEIYGPRPEADGRISSSERLRFKLTIQCLHPEGLKEVKKALLRIRLLSHQDLIPNFELIDSDGMIRELQALPDYAIDILQEGMARRLSEEEA
jgi:hypothetical protein